MLKCDDYKCTSCSGIFERFWDSDYEKGEQALCPVCGGTAERVFLKAPNVDSLAFSIWNGDRDSQAGTFTDKKNYYRSIETSGNYIHERGMDADAKRNEQYYLEAAEQKVFNKLDNHLRDLGGDEIRKRLKVDAAIQEATERGDANAIRRMGGMTSVDEAYRKAQDTQIVVEPVRSR